MIHTVS